MKGRSLYSPEYGNGSGNIWAMTLGIVLISALLISGNAFAGTPNEASAGDRPGAGTGVATVSDDDRQLAQRSRCYRTFRPRNGRVRLTACEYTGRSRSGYYRLHNMTNRDIRVCWVLHWRDGTSSRRLCNSRLRAGQRTRASCLSCNRKSRRGGVARVSWRVLQAR